MAYMAPVLVRTYTAKRQSDAAREMQSDARSLAQQGYEVVSQSWAEGRSGCLRFLLIGIFAFFWKPAGSLVVTYRLATVQ